MIESHERARFAPSITGQAHPGTLLAGLLCWLDARRRGLQVLLRLEDLDHTRLRTGLADDMVAALDWFGLDWDRVDVQSAQHEAHEAALDHLAAAGRLYPCQCSRKQRRMHGRRSPDGGFAYANTCRGRSLPAGGWRNAHQALRVRLDDGPVTILDESGLDLSQNPAYDLGDPIVRRRDGVLAYHLAVVVDDAAAGVNRIVRGRDLAASTATQVSLQGLLGASTPSYRHHLLLLEPQGGKLAKFHGAVGVDTLRRHYAPEALCGLLAHAAGLLDRPESCRPGALISDFDWQRVATRDRVMAWREPALVLAPQESPPVGHAS